MSGDWRSHLYSRYVTSGQGGAGAENRFASQKPMYDALIKTYFPEDLASSILDIACGAGGMLFALKEKGYFNIAGCDLSPEMIALAHRLGVSEAVEGDMHCRLNSTPDASQDVVIAMDVLEHLTREQLFCTGAEIVRVLKPAGRLIAHVPNAAGIFGSAVRYGDLTHELAFTEASIRQFLRVVGFGKIECFEDRPHVHGIKSLVRAGLWPALSLPFRLLNAVEAGRLAGVILSRNMTVVGFKA